MLVVKLTCIIDEIGYAHYNWCKNTASFKFGMFHFVIKCVLLEIYEINLISRVQNC